MTDETEGGPAPSADAPTEQPRNRGPRGPRRGGGPGGGGRGPGGPGRGPGGPGRGPGGDRRRGREPQNEERAEGELVDKLVAINRVAKVVKGGKNFAFAALVVVGDKKGRAGFGHGKAREVPEAIRKATEEAKKSLIRVPLREGRTLHHDGKGHWGAGKVMLRSAPAGTGLIAGGPMRAVLEVLGVSDVVAKSKGSSNPYNMVRATFDALKLQTSPRQVANRRGLKVSDIVNRRKDGASVGDVAAEG
jgi:small subunit ribosomal protein S5